MPFSDGSETGLEEHRLQKLFESPVPHSVLELILAFPAWVKESQIQMESW